jgi:hypothetical protein
LIGAAAHLPARAEETEVPAMGSSTQGSSPASAIRLGARPTAARTLHLATNGAPEFQRGKLLSEFFGGLTAC